MTEALQPERARETRRMVDVVPDAKLLDAAETLVAARIVIYRETGARSVVGVGSRAPFRFRRGGRPRYDAESGSAQQPRRSRVAVRATSRPASHRSVPWTTLPIPPSPA